MKDVILIKALNAFTAMMLAVQTIALAFKAWLSKKS
jgi:hypothetical protein